MPVQMHWPAQIWRPAIQDEPFQPGLLTDGASLKSVTNKSFSDNICHSYTLPARNMKHETYIFSNKLYNAANIYTKSVFTLSLYLH